MEDVPDRVWNLWKSYYQIEPWGGELSLFAKILASLKKLVSLKFREEEHIVAALKNIDQVSCAYMPGDWIGQEEFEPVQDSISATQSKLEAMG